MGDEPIKTIKVGDFYVDVKYRIIGGESTNSKDRAFEETGLRVYDKGTGRLLAKNVKLWKWYGDKEAQQNICGLRAAIYIEGSIQSYTKFGVVPAKNGINSINCFSFSSTLFNAISYRIFASNSIMYLQLLFELLTLTLVID